MAFNEDKTQVVSLDDGFDFLGFNVRRYRDKLLIKPSKAAIRRRCPDRHTITSPIVGSSLLRSSGSELTTCCRVRRAQITT